MKHLRLHLLSGVSLLIFLFLAFGSSDDNEKEGSVDHSSSSNGSKKSATIDQTPEQLNAQLKREIESFKDGFDNSAYDNTVESLQIEMAVFGAWALIIRRGEASSDKENQKLAATLKKKVEATQAKEFPILRKKYGKIVGNKLWAEDIYVSVNGKDYTTIHFTGGLFAANKNIQQTQSTLSEVLHMFRFKKVTYRWYKGQSEYTYYTLDSPKDRELFE